MRQGKYPGRNAPEEIDVDREMRFAVRAGLPMFFANEEDDKMRELGGDFPHYIGQRFDVGAKVTRVEATGERSALRPRLDLVRHSPDGFEWGYGGSGPSQLALAICADVMEDDAIALNVYQEFKRRVIEPLGANRWKMDAHSVRKVIDQIRESAQ